MADDGVRSGAGCGDGGRRHPRWPCWQPRGSWGLGSGLELAAMVESTTPAALTAAWRPDPIQEPPFKGCARGYRRSWGGYGVRSPVNFRHQPGRYGAASRPDACAVTARTSLEGQVNAGRVMGVRSPADSSGTSPVDGAAPRPDPVPECSRCYLLGGETPGMLAGPVRAPHAVFRAWAGAAFNVRSTVHPPIPVIVTP
jgi:hypothetical protein